MKNSRAAAYLLLMTAAACVGVRTARADGLEGMHQSAGAIFDNNGANVPSADNGGTPVITPGSGSGPGSPLTPVEPQGPKSSGVPLPAFVRHTADTFADNWKALLSGAAIGGLIGAGIGSSIPGAGTVAGALIGATLGMGMALLFAGKEHTSDMGKTLTGAGAGALVGMAFGSAFPVVGTILGGIAGALIGGLLTHTFF